MSPNAELIAHEIRDLSLAESGARRIDWAFHSMPVLQTIRKQLIRTQPFNSITIAACLHVTAETANLLITLRDAGATPVLCAPDSHSTQDDVAASLVRDYGISVYAIKGANDETQARHMEMALVGGPRVIMDTGAALLTALHGANHPEHAAALLGATECLAMGIARVSSLAASGRLPCPVFAISEAKTTQLFENRSSTGQSVVDGIVRATNLLLAGMTVVVAGYGSCGRGVAERARGLGASVVVTEVDPIRALEAIMDGCHVMSMGEAAATGDIFIAVSGSRGVIGREHLERLKDGAVLCNAGHSPLEIDLEALRRLSSSSREARPTVEEFVMRDGRRIYLLGEGRMVNLACAEGHPASVMDMSLANHALAVDHLVKQRVCLEPRVYPLPDEIDCLVARLKLESMGVKIDRLSLEQEKYVSAGPEST